MQFLKTVFLFLMFCCMIDLHISAYTFAQFWHDLWNPEEEPFVWDKNKDPCDRNCRGACIEQYDNRDYYLSFCNDDGYCICKKPADAW